MEKKTFDVSDFYYKCLSMYDKEVVKYIGYIEYHANRLDLEERLKIYEERSERENVNKDYQGLSYAQISQITTYFSSRAGLLKDILEQEGRL